VQSILRGINLIIDSRYVIPKHFVIFPSVGIFFLCLLRTVVTLDRNLHKLIPRVLSRFSCLALVITFSLKRRSVRCA